MNSRRQFLVASSAAVAAAALPKSMFAERLGGDVFSNASLGVYGQALLTQERFGQLVGSTFTLFLDDEKVARMTLGSVEDTTSTAQSTTTAPHAQLKTAGGTSSSITGFSLRFNVDVSTPNFTQDTYLVDHGQLGRFAMFLVPGALNQATATFSYLGDPKNWQLVTGPTPQTPMENSPMPKGGVMNSPVVSSPIRALPTKTALMNSFLAQ